MTATFIFHRSSFILHRYQVEAGNILRDSL